MIPLVMFGVFLIMAVVAVAGKPEGASFAGGDFEAELIATHRPEATGPAFMAELGFYATNDPEEEGLAYRLDSSDPVLIAAQQRYRALYGPLYAANRKAKHSKLALAGATVSTDIPTLPIFLEPGFVDNTPLSVLLARMIPRVPIRTKFVDWNTVDAVADASFVADVNEGDLPAAVEDDFFAQRIQSRVLARRLEYTGMAQAAAQGFVDLGNWRLRRNLQALLEHTEDVTVNGLAVDANGWSGLPEIVVTNTDDLLGATITTDDVDDLFSLVRAPPSKGKPTFGLASHGVINDLRKELKANQQIPVAGVSPAPVGGFVFPGGMNTIVYNGITLAASDFLDNTPGDRLLYLLQMDDLRYRELRPIMVEKLAKTRDADDWAATNYLTLQDMSANDATGPPGDGTGGQHHAVLQNIG